MRTEMGMPSFGTLGLGWLTLANAFLEVRSSEFDEKIHNPSEEERSSNS
jgi:hypothetical protein